MAEDMRDMYMKTETLREKMAENGRNYAENNFDIETITDRFEEIIETCWKGQPDEAAR